MLGMNGQMILKFARESPELTEISDGILEVCKVDVRSEITFPWAVKDIHDFVVFERLYTISVNNEHD